MKLNQILLLVISSVACLFSHAGVLWQEYQYKNVKFDVVEVDEFHKLHLFLNDQQQRPLINFKALSQQLLPCERLGFAMNAGMFHVDYRPVGLYVEKSIEKNALNNVTEGFGNFFMQPNGVLAWNGSQAHIMTTWRFQTQKMTYDYATQSGPMLLHDGKINSQFIPDSDSRKIRNAVGLAKGKLYFVMSQQAVNFYDLAMFMQKMLKAEQALYLDGGSVPSIYVAQANILREGRAMGPMLAYINNEQCLKADVK